MGAVVSADIAKPAVTVVAEPKVSVHVPIPEHPPPLQPLNVDPDEGAAVRVMEVPELNEFEQVPLAQEIPAGELVIVPVPVPEWETVSE